MGRGGIIWPETRGSEREREKRSRRARKSADEPYLLHPRSPPFSLLSLFPLVPPPPRSFIEHLVCVCACTIVWEQVRRRLKGRQPGGRRRSKGFRLVPATRRGGEEKNGVRRRRSSASRSGTEMRRARGRIKRDTRSEEGEMIRCSAGGRGLRRHRAPRIPYRSKATARKTTPRQPRPRPRPWRGLDGRPAARLLGKKEGKIRVRLDVF